MTPQQISKIQWSIWRLLYVCFALACTYFLFVIAIAATIPDLELQKNDLEFVRPPQLERSIEASKIIRGIITAYTSSIEETDDTPELTAAGTKTRAGVAANNCLPFGTEITIEGRTYVIEDRMNSRYDCRHYDIWLQDRDEAIAWGKKHLAITISE